MLIKIIWILIVINILVLLIFSGMFLAGTGGRKVDVMEKGWMTILAGVGVVIILLAAIPLRLSQSSFSIFFAGFFAALPLVITICVVISKKLPSFKKKQTMAEIYFKDITQRSIATAIEQNDTILLTQLIKGQDLNIRGNRVWDWDGLSYLQFAIRLRNNPDNYMLDIKANTAAINILINNGSAPTPALPEAIRCLPPETISMLLEAGANPNTHGFANNDPLLFEAISMNKMQNDIAILLVNKGANVNVKAKNSSLLTPVMFAANNARTSKYWNDVWRVVRHLLENAHADHRYTSPDGNSLRTIIDKIATDAQTENIQMDPDFYKVVEWLRLNTGNTASDQ